MQIPFPREFVLRTFPLERLEFDLTILKPQRFKELFGDNPEVPKTDAALLAYAQSLRTPQGMAKLTECAEYEHGLVFAGMANPAISDATRGSVENVLAGPAVQSIRRGDMKIPPPGRIGGGGLAGGGTTGGGMDLSLDGLFASLGGGTLQNTPAGTKPAFNRERIVGRFRFLYTDNNGNPTQNSTLANINATATVLSNAYTDFTTNFKEPQHYLRFAFKPSFPFFEMIKTIDVEVYDLAAGLNGSTSSFSNAMALCSNKVVNNNLKRQTTPVHELFHRVQYSHGYVSGTAGMKWFVEATASWSQKYRAPGVGDWMGRMNTGLGSPQNKLVDRSYDACHFWVYLGQRGNSEKLTMKDVWLRYSTNGKNVVNATDATVKARINPGQSYSSFVNWWNFTNFYKDLAATSANYTSWTYAENALVLNGNGPLSQVPRTTAALNVGTNYSNGNSVSAGGARYYVFNVGATVRRVEVKVTGANANFGYGVIDIKNNRGLTYSRTPAGNVKDQVYNKTYSANQVTQIAVVIMGIPNGGSFTVTAKGFSS